MKSLVKKCVPNMLTVVTIKFIYLKKYNYSNKVSHNQRMSTEKRGEKIENYFSNGKLWFFILFVSKKKKSQLFDFSKQMIKIKALRTVYNS